MKTVEVKRWAVGVRYDKEEKGFFSLNSKWVWCVFVDAIDKEQAELAAAQKARNTQGRVLEVQCCATEVIEEDAPEKDEPETKEASSQ